MAKKSMYICLRSIADIKNFSRIANDMEGNVMVSGGRYVINAKSVMGICSLDLSKPLYLEIEEYKEEYTEQLRPFEYRSET